MSVASSTSPQDSSVAPNETSLPDDSQLPPTRVKRKYSCKKCEFTTFNPREHLRHRRDMHSESVRIVCCDLCQYACQFKQKLTRHYNLMHRKDQKKRSSSSARSSDDREDFYFGPAIQSHHDSMYGLYRYQIDSRALEIHQQNMSNYNQQVWLQLQQIVAANQQHTFNSSFNYPNHPTPSEPLDLSISK